MEEKTTKITILVDGTQGKAETAEVSKGFDGIAKSAQSSAVVTTGAMNQIEASEKALAVTTEQLVSIQNQLEASTAEIATLQERLAAAEDQAATAAAQAAAAMRALAAGTTEAGEAADLTAGRMVRVGVAASRVADVAIVGGRAMSTLAGAFSVASLGTIALIAGIGILIGYLMQMFRAKEQDIQVTYDQIKANQQLLAAQQTGNLWTKTLAETTHDETVAKEALKQKISELHIARGNEADAIAGENRGLKEAARNQEDLRTKLVMYAYAMVASTGTIVENTEKRLEAEQGMLKEAEKLMDLRAAQGLSTEAMKAEMRTMSEDKNVLDMLIESINRGTYAEKQFAEGHSALGRIKQKVAYDFAESEKKATKATLEAAVAAEIEREGLTKSQAVLKQADANMKLMEEHTKDNTKALRAYNNELVNLAKAAKEAQIALESGEFQKRAQMIQIDIDAQRQHLEINKRDRLAALNYLAETERALLEKNSQDRIEAEQMVDVEIARMRLGADENEIDQKRKLMEIDIALKEQQLRKELDATVENEQRITDWKQAKREEFARWEADLEKKSLEARADAERQMLDELEREREARDKRTLADAVKLAKKMAEEVRQFAGQFQNLNAPFVGAERRPTIDQKAFDQLELTMRALSLTQGQFDVALQATNRDLAQFQQLMLRTQQFRTGNWFAGLIGSIKDVGKAFVLSGELGQQWSQAIVGAFDLTINSGANFVAAFGKLLLGGMMAAFGKMAITQGTFHILSGIARMATIWDFAGGLKEFAGGTALVAFGAALGAAGSMISSSATPSTAAASSAAGSTAAAASTTPAATGPKPVFLNVPSAAPSYAQETQRRMLEAQRDLAEQRSNREALAQRDALVAGLGPITIAITLGNDASTQFLTGLMNKKGVLTIDNAIGKHRQRLRTALSGA